jgi:ABC-type Fe3+-hydroxamate transport system substrate-binding protein
MSLTRPLAALAAVGALVLTACGSTEEAQPDTASTTGAAAPVSVTDARNKTMTLESPAERVVALEWNVVEHAVSLGVMPVGVSDVEGYSNWATSAPLDDTVTDVGVRGEPSVETIAGLEPDVILATKDLPESAIAQLEKLAPVVVAASADAEDNMATMTSDLRLVATATGTEDEAERLLAGLTAKLAAGRSALAEAGLGGSPFFMTDAWLDGGKVSIRPFSRGSLLSDVTERLGLVNAWPEKGDPMYGLSQTDVEGLTALPDDTRLLYIANDADGGDPFTKGLSGNAVWESLPFVKSGDVHRLPDGIWMFGGPASMIEYVDAVTAALV